MCNFMRLFTKVRASAASRQGYGHRQYCTVQSVPVCRRSSSHTQPIKNLSNTKLHVCLGSSYRPAMPRMIAYVLRKTAARIRPACSAPFTISDPAFPPHTQPIKNPSNMQLHICLGSSDRPVMPRIIAYVLYKTAARICCSFVALHGVKR